MTQEAFEGYCDALAGAGMQNRTAPLLDSYVMGHIMGSLDRKAMLQWREANEAGEA